MFADLVQVDRADVYKAGHLAAHLTRRVDHVEFSYSADYVSGGGRAVATSLPVTTETVQTPARAVPQYFAGLLPEGRRLAALRSALKTSADDDFSMLLAVGDDPVGDVQVVVAGEPVPHIGATARDAADITAVSFTELFALATGSDPDRGGIAGVQDKVSGRMISVPITYGGASHILKLDPPEFPHLVANEAFFLEMARDCGMTTTGWRLVRDTDGREGLLVERFDRIRELDGGITGLACEDGCQVARRYPADKYALDTEALVEVLTLPCAARLAAMRTIVRQLVFAVITGNGDLHAKNLSILHRDGEWQPSPAYDLPSTYPYGDHTMALAIAGTRQTQVSRRIMLELGVRLGLPARATLMVIDDLVAHATPWIDRLEQLPFDRRRSDDLRRLMHTRITLLSPTPGQARST